MGLPPFTYGAGLNLFHNRFLSFFMHNLGAYRVDRRKKAQIYKEILKEYATCSLEFGYNNLFFPGGTRNRLGEVERELKKGLLGTSIQAYTHNLQNKKPNPNFYIAPCTINYHLVLEARTLIEDALKEQGKRRYIIDDDEFSDLRKLYRFGTNLATLNAQIQIVIGQIYDPFGNRVDGSGQSYDQRDRPIDITRYVTRNGQPVVDLQRDREYTNEVSSRIVEQFSRNNMIMTTHIMAYTCFQLLRQKNPDMDLYRLLHTGGFVDQLSVLEVCHATEQNLQRLKQLEAANQIRLEPTLHRQAVEDIVSSGLQFFNSYHTKPAIHRQGDWILSGDLPLLYYYNNRLNGYPING
jgi:glycerol-3-phosphate O-acyltransferase